MYILNLSTRENKALSMIPYRIVLADDHALLRGGLKKILEGRGGLAVIGEAADGLEALALLGKVRLDMIILDISMPNLGGIETTKRIKSLHPEVKVLILTMHNSPEYLQHAMAAGADGYLLKEDANEDLFAAIEKIRQGEPYISPQISGKGRDQSLQKS
jgi:DNA-binding NarL/FixJ family response regulator